MGAVDVVPFVPIEGVTMADCVAAGARDRRSGGGTVRRAGVPLRGGRLCTGTAQPRGHPARRVRRPRGQDGSSRSGGRISGRPRRTRQRRRLRHRGPHAAHRLQHQPGDRPAGRREKDRRGGPAQQRRAALRESHGNCARGPRDRAGLDEPHQLREDADARAYSSSSRARRRATACACSRARSSGWCPRRRWWPRPSGTCSSTRSRVTRCWSTGCARRGGARVRPRVSGAVDRGGFRRISRAGDSRTRHVAAGSRTALYGRSSSAVTSPRRGDAERAHLAVEIAALDAERLGGARHVALLRGQHPQDVLLLEPVARGVQRQQVAAGRDGHVRR